VSVANQSSAPGEFFNDYLVPYPRSGNTSTNVGHLLGAVDPLAIAQRLALEYIDACDAVIDYTVASSDATAPDPGRVTKRHEKLLLARVLRSMLGSDPSDHMKIRDEFEDGTGQCVGTYIEQWERQLAKLIETRELKAAKLAMYLESDVFRFAEGLYRTSAADEAIDYHLFLQIVATAHKRLSESANGRILLGRLTGRRPYWLSTYVLPEAPLTDAQFQVSRKSAAALLEVWEEAAKALIADAPQQIEQTFTTLETQVERVTRQKLWANRRGVKAVRYKKGTTFVTTTVTLTSAEIVAEQILRERLEQWLPDHSTLNVVFNRLHQSFEIINLASAASTLLQERDSPAAFNLLGSCLDTVSAFEPLLKLTGLAKERVGRASAVIDIYLAGKDGAVAYDQSNYGALVGSALVAAGSTMGFVGTLSAVEMLGLSLSGWGAIVVAVGYVTTAFLSDSDLEIFVSHCCFGKHYGEGDTTPKWATAPLKAWKGSYSSTKHSWDGNEQFGEQLKSLFNIICAFSIHRVLRNNRARIRYGFITPKSIFRVRARILGSRGATRSFELAVRIADLDIAREGGDLPDLSIERRRFPSDSDATKNWFEIELNVLKRSLPESEQDAFDAPSAVIQVQLDIFGDASFNHPTSFVPYDLRTPTGNDGAEGASGDENATSGAGSEPVNSKDYL
jgi:hypothetical protein